MEPEPLTKENSAEYLRIYNACFRSVPCAASYDERSLEPLYGEDLAWLAKVDGVYAGAIVLEDTVKSGAKESLAALRSLGVQNTCMLTGDREAAAKLAAENLGMTDYRAGLLPQDKLTQVQKLLDEGRTVDSRIWLRIIDIA